VALRQKSVEDMFVRSRRLDQQFCLVYAEIWQSAIARFAGRGLPEPIWQTLIAKSGQNGAMKDLG